MSLPGRRLAEFILDKGDSLMMKQFFMRLWQEEQGQDLVEYALIVAAVGLALITTVNQLSTAVVSLYSSITQGLTSIGATGQ